MLANDRKLWINEQLEKNRSITLQEICDGIHASSATVRRDLEEMEKNHLLKRVHGGAISIHSDAILYESNELSSAQKKQMHTDEKTRLCRAAADLVEDGDCIFIDGGTTFIPMVAALKGKHVQIVTNSDLIRQDTDSTISIITLGGLSLSRYQMNVGPIALENMKQFSFDKAFIGCAGIDIKKDAAYTAETDSAQIKKEAMHHSITSYLLIDPSKIGTHGFYQFSHLKDFDGIFTIADRQKLPRKFIPVR